MGNPAPLPALSFFPLALSWSQASSCQLSSLDGGHPYYPHWGSDGLCSWPQAETGQGELDRHPLSANTTPLLSSSFSLEGRALWSSGFGGNAHPTPQATHSWGPQGLQGKGGGPFICPHGDGTSHTPLSLLSPRPGTLLFALRKVFRGLLRAKCPLLPLPLTLTQLGSAGSSLICSGVQSSLPGAGGVHYGFIE